MKRTLVKICGLTGPEDIDMMNGLRPDVIGFVFAESRRKLIPAKAGDLAARLAPGIRKAGVFADSPTALILEAVAMCGLDMVQLHGSESPSETESLRKHLDQAGRQGVLIWKTVGVQPDRLDRTAADRVMEQAAAYRTLAGAIVLDAKAPVEQAEAQAGGHGRCFDWDLARLISARLAVPIILAGGLGPKNVAAAIHMAGPWMVDVSSGVETEGRKDYEKIRAFMENARNATKEDDDR